MELLPASAVAPRERKCASRASVYAARLRPGRSRRLALAWTGVWVTLAWGVALSAQEPPAATPPPAGVDQKPAAPTVTPAPPPDAATTATPAPVPPAPVPPPTPAPPAQPEPAQPGAAPPPALPPATTPAAPTPPPVEVIQVPGQEDGLRLNFRGVALDTALDYLSKAAGFVIVREVEIRDRIDIQSQQPLNKDETVQLLNTILNDKGYALLRSDRILKIVSKADAKTRDIPIRTGGDPEAIPKTDEMVTQIIPVMRTDATKLVENLKPLLPPNALMTTNASSNAIVLTDTQLNIRRMAEVIKALDTSISNILQVKVMALQYADAEELAKVINEVFKVPTGQTPQRGGGMGQFFARMRGFGPPGEGPPGGGSSDQDASDAKAAAAHVSAVAETRSNSVVVSAPSELMPEIEELVKELDVRTDATTTIAVFPLRYAEALTLAETITQLFEDDATSSTSRNQFGMRRPFFFGGMMPPGQNQSQQGQQTQRRLAEARVVAVADTRTNSLIVSASAETMVQIRKVIEELDANPAKDRQVHVYKLENADAERLKTILGGMFEDFDGTRNTTGSQRSMSQPTTAPGRAAGQSGFGLGNSATQGGFGQTRPFEQ